MKRMMSLILSMVVAVSLLSGCQKADTGTFKIGLTGPLTGDAALYGTAVKRGAEIAVAEINAKGGIQFELRAEDDTHDAEKAVNACVMLGHKTTPLFTYSALKNPFCQHN